MFEEWKPVTGFDNYEVSSLGNVRSIIRTQLKLETVKRGYKRIALHAAGNIQRFQVHRLVAAAFIGKCPDGYVVNHKDGDTSNNERGNLEYVTQSENILHSFRVLGRQPHHQGEKTHFAKMTENDVIQIRQLREEGWTYAMLAAKFNTKPANMWHVCSGRTWRHLL